MTKRRIITVALLFALAFLTIVVLNRLPFFKTIRSIPRVRVDVSQPNEYRAEFFDRTTGERIGQLVASRYETLDDGSIGASDVSVELAGTNLGDIALTCDKAEISLRRSEEGYTGRARLIGNVVFEAERDGVKTLSGKFEDVTFDAGDKSFSVSGPIEVASSEGMSFSGTDATGVAEEDRLQFAVKRHVRMEFPSSQRGNRTEAAVEAPAAGGEEPQMPPVVVEAGGPFVFNQVNGTASLAGGVTVSRGDESLSGSALDVGLAPKETDGASGASFDVASITMAGPLEGHREDFSFTGERLSWSAESLSAQISGRPALFASGEGFIESPLLDIRFTEAEAITAIRGTGPGSAFFPAPVADADGGTRDREKSFAASWTKHILFEALEGRLEAAGDVAVDAAGYSGHASTIVVTVAEAARRALDAQTARKWFDSFAENVSSFEADGGVDFNHRKIVAKGDRLAYRSDGERMELVGRPATAAWKNITLSSRRLVYEAEKGTLAAERDCRIVAEVPGEEDQPPTVVTARAPRIIATVTEENMRAECGDTVEVEWPDSRLTCTSLAIEARAAEETGESAGTSEAAAPGEEASDAASLLSGAEIVRIEGQGRVVFRQDDVTCRCDSFTYEAASDVLRLAPAEGDEIELAFGDSATVWCLSVAISRKDRTVQCERPRVVMWVSGSFAGFRQGERKGGVTPASKSKIDLVAGGDLLIRQTSDDSATIDLSGGVEVSRWDSGSTDEDRLASRSLSLGCILENGSGGAASFREARVVTARASGEVYLRYSGTDETLGGGEATLEGRGDLFTWDEELAQGRLSGSPATAWIRGPKGTDVQKAQEFIYYFNDQTVELVTGGEGVLTLDRPPGR